MFKLTVTIILGLTEKMKITVTVIETGKTVSLNK
jgi:hypothetical protein